MTIRTHRRLGLVRYFKNDQLIAVGSPRPDNALRVSVSLRDVNATITNGATTF